MYWISTRYFRWLLTALVLAMGAVLLFSTFGDPLPGIDHGHFTAAGMAITFLGLAIGYRRWGESLGVLLIVLVLISDEIFTAGFYRSVVQAPFLAFLWWALDLLFGLSCGYLARLKETDRWRPGGKG